MSGTEGSPLRIVRLVHEKDAIHIVLEDGATYRVAPSAPEAAPWQVGDRLDEEAQRVLGQADERKRAAVAALRLLGRKPYPASSLRERLISRGLSEVAVDAVIAQLQEQGLLDDVRYAEAYARTQLARRPVSRRWLRAKLVEQGVAPAAASRGVDAVLPVEDEEGWARRALVARHGRLDDQSARARALRFLLSRGFSRELSTHVILNGGAEADEHRDI